MYKSIFQALIVLTMLQELSYKADSYTKGEAWTHTAEQYSQQRTCCSSIMKGVFNKESS